MTLILRLALYLIGEEQVRCRLKASISVSRILYQNDHLVS